MIYATDLWSRQNKAPKEDRTIMLIMPVKRRPNIFERDMKYMPIENLKLITTAATSNH